MQLSGRLLAERRGGGSDLLCDFDGVQLAGTQRLPAVWRDGGPAFRGVLGDAGETLCCALREPLLPVTHVRDDLRNRTRKVVRLREGLLGGESFQDCGRAVEATFAAQESNQ